MRSSAVLLSLSLVAEMLFTSSSALAAPRWLDQLKGQVAQCLDLLKGEGAAQSSQTSTKDVETIQQTVAASVAETQHELHPTRSSGVKSILLEAYDSPQFGPGRVYISKEARSLQNTLNRIIIELVQTLRAEHALKRKLQLEDTPEQRHIKGFVTTAINSLPALDSLTPLRPIPFISLPIEISASEEKLSRLNVDLQAHEHMLSLSIRYPEMPTDQRRVASHTIQKMAPPEGVMIPFHQGVLLYAEKADDASFNPFTGTEALGAMLTEQAGVSKIDLHCLRENLNRHLLLSAYHDKLAPLLSSIYSETLERHLKALRVNELQTTGDLMKAIHSFAQKLPPNHQEQHFKYFFSQEPTYFSNAEQVFTSAPFLQQAEASLKSGKNLTISVFASVNFKIDSQGHVQIQSPDERCLSAPAVTIDVAADESTNDLPLDQFRAVLASNEELEAVAKAIKTYLEAQL